MDEAKQLRKLRDKLFEYYPRLCQIEDRQLRLLGVQALTFWVEGRDGNYVQSLLSLTDAEVEIFKANNCWPWQERIN